MFSPDPPHDQTGLTLVEMLVVLAIIGVMAGAVVLSAGAADGRGPEVEARRLAARLELAADETMVTGRTIAFVRDRTSYRFVDWKAGKWQDDKASALEPHVLPSGLILDGAAPGPIVLGADGGGNPVTVRVASARGGNWTVAFDGMTAEAKAGG